MPNAIQGLGQWACPFSISFRILWPTGKNKVSAVHKGEFKVVAAGVLGHPGGHGTEIADPVVFPGLLVKTVKTFPGPGWQ
jgi:hypothetical protein